MLSENDIVLEVFELDAGRLFARCGATEQKQSMYTVAEDSSYSATTIRRKVYGSFQHIFCKPKRKQTLRSHALWFAQYGQILPYILCVSVNYRFSHKQNSNLQSKLQKKCVNFRRHTQLKLKISQKALEFKTQYFETRSFFNRSSCGQTGPCFEILSFKFQRFLAYV